ncbi:right-handed parallel beta-helix repeat-containing protein [Subtercola vilae]|uniref:DUF1565 domain-containing protein n=1 Tax=Subtercola vilae TaxID=2056433 RepID=A0A4T2BU76_9MICO|nr:right-handed parallel beta-helix repeat-containing protein [Subtercola vilae]TIH33088.1 DUF1565 domain-containing protein [Subtercola vilae]
MTTIFHVATTGSDTSPGHADSPLRTINQAAARARPGDTVIVHDGIYREWVKPQFGGSSDIRRITYQAAAGEHVIITGSEHINSWEHEHGTVWKAVIPNAFFGTFNPFAEELNGDWIVYAAEDSPKKHLGDVYLNGKSFYEVLSHTEVSNPTRRTTVVDDWTATTTTINDPAQTCYVWYAEVDEDATTIWANFHNANPNTELVEINVRRSVFYPTEHHLDYITVRGFELSQSASPWTPPTADQPGLIGPNWAKGWVIEDNIIHDAKCSAISIGKEKTTGHNFATDRRDKPGYQYQLESVFSARQIGWDREHVGSHLIRRNTIYDCGQNGIVGHLGCVFSTIEDNHIYNIALKREFYGYEIGGIKLHAAIDVIIRHNRIHDTSLGIWLDWQTQGTRLSRNVLYNNSRDLFVEVSHGPYLVEHNIFGSSASLEIFSQGGAFVNNLVLGSVLLEPVVERPTPYHVPHSTQVAGYAAILGGDDRHIGNLFLGSSPAKPYGADASHGHGTSGFGLAGYNGHPAHLADYLAMVNDPTRGDHERFAGAKQPVYVRDNTYAAGAEPYELEANPIVLKGPASAAIIEADGHVYLTSDLPPEFDVAQVETVSGHDLLKVRFVDADFEERDGSTATFLIDVNGVQKEHGSSYPPGPIAPLTSGLNRTRIW